MVSRLTIKYQGVKIGVDIEEGVSLPDALSELARALKNIEAGDFDEIEDGKDDD